MKVSAPLLAAFLVACGEGASVPSSGLPAEGVRIEMPRVYFSRWTDFLSLQAGLSTRCLFLDPQVEDFSTSWPPLQVFWVIYDDPSDVKDGDRIRDIYFEGDELAATEFETRAGKSALGFKFLPPSQRAFLDIKELSVAEDGRSVEATLGAPLHVTLFVEAERDADSPSGCRVETRYCEASDRDAGDCVPEPLSAIDVTLNGLYLVQEVAYR